MMMIFYLFLQKQQIKNHQIDGRETAGQAVVGASVRVFARLRASNCACLRMGSGLQTMHTLRNAQNTSVSTPLSNFSPSGPSHVPIPFTGQPMRRAPMRPAALARGASFKHAENSWFQPPTRRKSKGSRLEGPNRIDYRRSSIPTNGVSNLKSLDTPKAERTSNGAPFKQVTGSARRNPLSSSKGQKSIQWHIDHIKKLDINDLKVIELPNKDDMNEEKTNLPVVSQTRTTFSIPLSVTDNVEDEDSDLPLGWRRLTSRTTRQIYYGNIYTGESSWTRPLADSAQVELDLLSAKPAGSSICQWPASHEDSIGDANSANREEASVSHQAPLATSTIIGSKSPESAHPQLLANTSTDQNDVRAKRRLPDKTFDDVTSVSLLNDPSAQAQHDTIISVDSGNREDDVDHLRDDCIESGAGHTLAADPSGSEPTGAMSEHVIPAYCPSGTPLGRIVSISHLVMSLVLLVSTCTLLGLQSKWKGTAPEWERCSAGPPLLEWAVGMSFGLVVFAALAHVLLISRDRALSRRPGQILTAIGAAANLAAFVLGQVWVFLIYPSSGCKTLWTLPHVEYATASVLIICIYLGYALAAAAHVFGGGLFFPTQMRYDRSPEIDPRCRLPGSPVGGLCWDPAGRVWRGQAAGESLRPEYTLMYTTSLSLSSEPVVEPLILAPSGEKHARTRTSHTDIHARERVGA